ncbi:hypothetical protein SK128_004979, partial [Halocaridina rubra]
MALHGPYGHLVRLAMSLWWFSVASLAGDNAKNHERHLAFNVLLQTNILEISNQTNTSDIFALEEGLTGSVSTSILTPTEKTYQVAEEEASPDNSTQFKLHLAFHRKRPIIKQTNASNDYDGNPNSTMWPSDIDYTVAGGCNTSAKSEYTSNISNITSIKVEENPCSSIHNVPSLWIPILSDQELLCVTNEHWLEFDPPSTLSHHIFAVIYVVVLVVGCVGNAAVIILFI